MDEVRSQFTCRLIGEQLIDWCKQREEIRFNPADCSQERCIRFTTPLLQSIFPRSERPIGAWKNGQFLMYEIHNGIDRLQITATVSMTGLLKKQRVGCEQLLAACGQAFEASGSKYDLKVWHYPGPVGDWHELAAFLQDFADFELPYFETELAQWKHDHSYQIKSFPNVSLLPVSREALPEELLLEGAMTEILTNRYERNLTARKRCIAAHGTACNICGFDFGVVYGPAFAGKIEVHHIIPLHDIQTDYVVDPVNDLIPVCPNCHMLLHSKPDGGTYTPDEVRSFIHRNHE